MVAKNPRYSLSRGEMAQSISHDLRNHLAAIHSNVEFMSESRTTDVEREELLEEVRAVIQAMTGMLDSLLLLAKTGQRLLPRWRSLNEVVEHVAPSMVMVMSALHELVVEVSDIMAWRVLLPQEDRAPKDELTRSFLSYLGAG
jgi:signal transduction histidine kinase